MHFILDGYNIIFKMSSLFPGNIKDSRAKLIHYIKTKRPHGSCRNPVTIVFDSSQVIIDYPIPPGIDIKFSHGITADDYIIKLIEKSLNRRLITLVSDDRELQFRAKHLDANSVGVEEFFKPKKNKPSKSATKPELTRNDMKEIADELLTKTSEDG